MNLVRLTVVHAQSFTATIKLPRSTTHEMPLAHRQYNEIKVQAQGQQVPGVVSHGQSLDVQG